MMLWKCGRVAMLASVFLWSPAAAQPAEKAEAFRPPAVPLVTHDPYLSVWSTTDRLTDGWTTHWTGATQAMCGMARIDGKPYRFLGPHPAKVAAMSQESLRVLPTRTIYRFEQAGVRITLTFTSPLLPQDLDVLARPVTYVGWEVQAVDDRGHAVSLYFDCSAELAVNAAEQPVVWSRFKVGDLDVLRVGTKEQPVLAKKGDNLRIDWGYFYVAVPRHGGGAEVITDDRAARDTFAATGKLPDADDLGAPRAANDHWPVLACAFDLGAVGARMVARHVLLAYDDLFSIEYMRHKLRPYWRRNGMTAGDLLRSAEGERAELTRKCEEFDEALSADLNRVGGRPYARLAALAYRQCLAAHKLVSDTDGTPLLFSKENFSNGCIDTVDVTYPSSPFFLLFNTTLLRGQLKPILDYAQSSRWRHPFAPHDLGTYPRANGQVYGGGEKSERDQMPVEECGNMLLMMAAMARTDGNADFALKYWPVLTRWAEYLRNKGLDPENQLCTDDFAGHLAHNTNLSLKAIEALGGYALLCEMAGKKEEAAAYRKRARAMAARWVKMADDGDHYRLAFDRPGTWSQKYNLVWDRLLGLDLFPPEVARKEIAYYKTKQKRFGLPLDNRSAYTKLDWEVWTATLDESPEDFAAFIDRLDRFARQSPSRVPLTDWYWTTDGKQRGFQARSVVGGVYIKMLADPAVRKKWAGWRRQK